MTTEEMLLQLIEGQKRTDEHFKKIDKRLDKIEDDISDIKEDISEIKYEAKVTRTALNRQGDMLDQLVDFVNDFLPAEFKYDPNK